MPGHEFPQTDVAFADKWAHWLMYGTLSICMARVLHSYLLIFFLSSAYGALMEVLQATLTTTRSGEMLDAAANAFGALCGILLIMAYRRYKGINILSF